MKIYFAGAIRGGREDAELYGQIVKHLQTYGEVLTEHVSDKDLTTFGETKFSEEYIHDRDLAWMEEADVIVAEVTTPSLGVGYEIGIAVENNKKVLCLYRPQIGRRLSAMVAGCSKLTNLKYETLEEAKEIIDSFFK